MSLWEIFQGRAPGETFTDQKKIARILASTAVQGGVDMQQIHPRPPSHRRRWLHCGFPVKSSSIRHLCSSLICVTSGPAYSHIHPRGRIHIWLMCIWKHKCHSFWTTCSFVGPAKEFRIHWSFIPLWSATSPHHPHHLYSPIQPASLLILSLLLLSEIYSRKWAVLEIVRLKISGMRRRYREKTTKR